MHSALDRLSDALTAAQDAVPGRGYRCARCRAPVTVRAGAIVAPYFAHAAGEADRDCELYFPSQFVFTGRRLLREATEEPRERSRLGDLFFEFALDGPRLSIWLPSSGPEAKWPGRIQLIAHQLSRALTAQHLEHGQLITFPLADGQWSVSVTGDVDESYLSLLDLGPNALESGLNLFDATRGRGRRLGPSDALRLGDSLWVITRDSSFPGGARGARVSCDLTGSVGGWMIYHVDLPPRASSEEIRILSAWLQRYVRPPAPRVWIAQPLATAYTADGIPVLPVVSGGITVKADQPLDLSIKDPETLRVVRASNQTQELRWNEAKPGLWQIFVGSEAAFKLSVSAQSLVPTPAVSVAIEGSESVDLFTGQGLLDAFKATDNEAPKALITWHASAVGALVHVDGSPLVLAEQQTEVEILGRSELLVEVSNLGFLRWPSRRATIVEAPQKQSLEGLAQRAHWLLSVSVPRGRAPSSVTVPDSLRGMPSFSLLSERSWDNVFCPHLRTLQNDMERATA